MTISDVWASRRIAAEASGGISDEHIYKGILKEVKRLGSSGVVLDFGAGTGALAARIGSNAAFERVDAIDLIKYAREEHPKVRWFSLELNQPTELKGDSYDLIVCAEVIEHLENPRLISREWFRLLRPGGYVVMSTPNNESWRSIISLVVRGHFAAFTVSSYPAHITALLHQDLQRILSEAGFSNLRFSYTNFGSIPGIPRRNWQASSFGLLKGLRFSDNIIASAQKPRI